jgi:integrase
MSSVYKRGNKWRAEVTVLGNRIYSTHDTRSEAWLWAEEQEHAMGSTGKVLPGKTVRDAFNRYIREIAPKRRGGRWEIIRLTKIMREAWTATQLTRLTTEQLQAWIDASPLQAESVRRDVTAVRGVFKVCRKRWKWMSEDPFVDVEQPKPGKSRFKRVPAALLAQVLDAMAFDEKADYRGTCWESSVAFMLAIETAMRRGELWSLDWKDVHLEQRFLHLDITKNGDERDVPLSKRAVELFELIGVKEAGPVLLTSKASAEALWRRKLKQYGIIDLHFHDSRHEAITRLSKKLTLLELSRAVGVRDPRTLMVYYNPTASELAAMLD